MNTWRVKALNWAWFHRSRTSRSADSDSSSKTKASSIKISPTEAVAKEVVKVTTEKA